jgi:hypothetical protein
MAMTVKVTAEDGSTSELSREAFNAFVEKTVASLLENPAYTAPLEAVKDQVVDMVKETLDTVVGMVAGQLGPVEASVRDQGERIANAEVQLFSVKERSEVHDEQLAVYAGMVAQLASELVVVKKRLGEMEKSLLSRAD